MKQKMRGKREYGWKRFYKKRLSAEEETDWNKRKMALDSECEEGGGTGQEFST